GEAVGGRPRSPSSHIGSGWSAARPSGRPRSTGYAPSGCSSTRRNPRRTGRQRKRRPAADLVPDRARRRHAMSSSPSSEARTLPEEGTRRGPTVHDTRPRRMRPIGAECQPDGGVHFRVWAPQREQVRVALDIDGTPRGLPPPAEGTGYFSGLSAEARAGTLYRFQLGTDDTLYPDPAARFQPEGPSGPSRVVDPGAFAWSDADWAGATMRGQVIYEMHIGTFTPERTWSAATQELSELARLGVTCLEIMPIAE